MNRRRILAALGTVGLASGVGSLAPEGSGVENAASTDEESETVLSPAEQGIPSNICESDVFRNFRIRAIDEPAFGRSWEGYSIDDKYLRVGGLSDETPVIGLECDGKARAYPIPILFWHEIVNDTVDGPLFVSHCPLCDSGLVARRRLDGETTTFGVSGQLWRAPLEQTVASERGNRIFGVHTDGEADEDASVRDSGNLVMYDELTESFWSQILAVGICGPMEGTRLRLEPSRVTTWTEWRGSHSGTTVLLPPPHSGAK